MESDHAIKKRYSHGNDNFKNCSNTYANTKGFVDKKANSDNRSKCRILLDIYESEEKTTDDFVEELCTNLHEHNKILMCKL